MDSVFDAKFVVCCNTSLEDLGSNSSIQNAISAIQRATANSESGIGVIRWNKKLLAEYRSHIKEFKNDAIRVFFENLNHQPEKGTLSRQKHSIAIQCGWPDHDQHILAAAVDAERPCVHIGEAAHNNAAPCIKRRLSIKFQFVDFEKV